MPSIARAEPSPDDLGEEIATLAAALWAGTARFLALLSVFDEREGHARWGIGSSAQWLAWHCGLSPVAAREYVRVARALRRRRPPTHVPARSEKISCSKPSKIFSRRDEHDVGVADAIDPMIRFGAFERDGRYHATE